MENFTDEQLMRFADGELDDETSTRLEAALVRDTTLSERLALFADTRAMARSAFAPLLHEPVPSDLLDSVRAMADRQRQPPAAAKPASGTRRPANDWKLLPLAASLAAAIAGVAGYLVGSGLGDGDASTQLAALSNTEIYSLLSKLPAGQQIKLPSSNVRLRTIASFRSADGQFCREFELDRDSSQTIVSVACRDAAIWSVRLAVVAPAESSGYAPASSLETLDAYLTSIGAVPLAEGEERAILSKGVE